MTDADKAGLMVIEYVDLVVIECVVVGHLRRLQPENVLEPCGGRPVSTSFLPLSFLLRPFRLVKEVLVLKNDPTV